MSSLDPQTLKPLRDAAWVELQKRYPNDATISFIVSVDRMLAATSFESKTDVQIFTSKRKKRSKNPNSFAIAEAAYKLFTQEAFKPLTAEEVVMALRRKGISLPSDTSAAITSVTAIFSRRPHSFQKFTGNRVKDPYLWHLASNHVPPAA